MNTIFRKYQQVLNKRKLAAGGIASADPIGMIAQQVAQVGSQLGNGLADSMSPPDEYGYQSVGANVMKGWSNGMGTGPFGIGAPIGAALGLAKGLKDRTAEKDLRGTIMTNNRINQTNQSNAILGQNPQLASGFANASYFKDGGTMGRFVKCATGGSLGPMPNRSPLNDLITSGGKAKQLSSDNAEIVGQSHAQGGVQIPGLQSEVEGGETTKDNFVFSKALGFAKLHKPLARAKGIIEKKVQTKERVNSLKRIADRENELAEQQEMFKQQNGMQ